MIQQFTSRFSVLILLLTIFISIGCGKQTVDGRPQPVPVSGVVKYKQEACADAQLVFAPEDHQYAAYARTDSQGRFQLQTFDPGDGAVPGRFKVVVTKFEAIDLPDGGFKETFFLPEKYRNAETSGLTATVPPEGTNTIEIDLVD